MNLAVFVSFLPMVFSQQPVYQPPLVTEIQTMIPHQEPVILPVCLGCVLQQDDESEIITEDMRTFGLLSETDEILVILKDGQKGIYGKEPMPVMERWIDEDLPDLWIKFLYRDYSETLHFHIRRP